MLAVPAGRAGRSHPAQWRAVFDRFYTQEDEDRHLAILARHDDTARNAKEADSVHSPSIRNGTQDVFISRSEARDVQKYRAADRHIVRRSIRAVYLEGKEK